MNNIKLLHLWRGWADGPNCISFIHFNKNVVTQQKGGNLCGTGAKLKISVVVTAEEMYFKAAP